MKKFYSFLVLCLMGTMGAWAEDTYESVYSKVLEDWSDDDKTDWNASGAVEVNTTNGIGANNNQTATYLSKSFSVADGSKIKYEVDWTFATATGRTNNWNWIQFGSFLRLAVNSSYNVQVSTDAGTTWSETTLGYYYNTTVTKRIEVIFNTQTNTVEQLSFDGTDRTSLVTGSFNNATFNTVSTGFVRGGSVSWTLNNYITNITVSEAQQAAAAEVSYTINYLYNEEVIKSDNGTLVVGSTFYAESPITIDDTRYYAADGVATSKTVSATAEDNVLNVQLRLPNTYSYSVTAVDGENNLLKTLSSGSYTEGDAAISVSYPRYILSGTTLYASGTGAVSYSATFTPDADSYVKSITFNSGTVTGVAYYTEGEDVSGVSGATNAGRASVGKMGYTGSSETYVDVTTLVSGKYKIYMRGQNGNSAARAFNFKVGEDVVFTGSIANGTNMDYESEEFSILESSTLSYASEGSSMSGVDYFYLVRTGNSVEQITIASGSTGLGSYVTTDALDFSKVDGLKAYVATAEKTDKVMITPVTEVPARTAIFVRGTAGETYPVPVGTCETLAVTNLLQGNATTGHTVADGETIYALMASTGKLAKVNEGVTIPEKKAYLVSTGGSLSAKAISFTDEEDEEATAVATVEAEAETGAKRLFNAAGQQVGAGYKGLVIDENGKKYVRK